MANINEIPWLPEVPDPGCKPTMQLRFAQSRMSPFYVEIDQLWQRGDGGHFWAPVQELTTQEIQRFRGATN